MKRMVLTGFSLLLVFALCACSSSVSDVPETENTTVATTEEVTEATQPSEETVPVPEPDLPVVDFTTLLQEVSAQHVETVASETALDSIAKYLIEDPETVDLLTKE